MEPADVMSRNSFIHTNSNNDPFRYEEVSMKVRFPVVLAVSLIMWFHLAGPAWSQQPAQQPAQPTAQQPVQQPAQPAAQPAEQSSAHLAEAVVCQDVVNRAPVGSGDVFAKEIPKVYCYTHVVGATPGTQLTHNWYYKGTLKASVKLKVGSLDFRTWSSKTMIPQWAGEWMVEILDADGKPMESIIFSLK
jgi:hypothetical protein